MKWQQAVWLVVFLLSSPLCLAKAEQASETEDSASIESAIQSPIRSSTHSSTNG
ncbi:hypothetical protein [Vibrio ponticus]|uniref:hypothetical protein n=1 Tax=Vibrio ponticus TaxID=265668 RepID=UPI0016130E4F|nr:hypothetical protein [Vibrio ponticus]